MRPRAKKPLSVVTSTYWLVLSIFSGVVALFPLAILLLNFVADPSSNPFDERGYGAVIWILFLSVPTGGIIFAVGALAAVAIEWFAARKRNRSR